MLYLMARNWWLTALRGLMAVVFGILALVWPLLTLNILVLLFGVYALFEGFLAIVGAFTRQRQAASRLVLILEGLVGIIVGLLAVIWPAAMALALLYLLAAWALITGFLRIIAAVQLRRELRQEWLLGLAGLLSVIFGILLIFWPASGLLALVWLVGAYAIIFGIVLFVLALRLRRWRGTPQRMETA